MNGQNNQGLGRWYLFCAGSLFLFAQCSETGEPFTLIASSIQDESSAVRSPRDITTSSTFQEDVLPTTSYQQDATYVWQGYPNQNFDGDGTLLMGRSDVAFASAFVWPYLRFDLSGVISPKAQVTRAVLSLYVYTKTGNDQHGSSHQVLSAWNEANLVYSSIPADWNNGLIESQVLISGANQWVDWDVANMASNWVAHPEENFGLAILPTDSLYNGDTVSFRSDDYGTSSYRPKLTVDYVLPERRAAFVSQVAPPEAMYLGQKVLVSLTFENLGVDTWSEGANVRLQSQTPPENTFWGANRILLPQEAAPDAQITFDFEITAPTQPGSYAYQWQLFQEGFGWFGESSPLILVSVDLKPNGLSCLQPSECSSGSCQDGVCCESDCSAPCQFCALPDSPGVCRAVPAGEDPRHICLGEGPCRAVCAGTGLCRFPKGEICGTASCSGQSLTLPPTCDGEGACSEQGSVSCSPFGCDGDSCASYSSLGQVSIENAPDGNGQVIANMSLSTDESFSLYAIGRDSSGIFLGQVLVSWSVAGGIGEVEAGPSSFAIFNPTAVGRGRVLADFYRPEVQDGGTGDLIVSAGVAAGEIPVQASPRLIPADGSSLASVTCGPVRDADGNIVANGTALTILVSAGVVQEVDQNPLLPGLQLATQDGFVVFSLSSDIHPQAVQLRVVAVDPGQASGSGVVFFGDGRPLADAGADQRIHSGEKAELDGSGSYSVSGAPLSYLWSQIQGSQVKLNGDTTAKPTFTGPAISGQEVLVFQLVVTDENGTSDPAVTRRTILGTEPNLPTAIMVLEPESGPAPLEVMLDGSASSAAEGSSLVGYWWIFSDGFANLQGTTATRTFQTPGGVGVLLLVQDDQGRFAWTSASVMVGGQDRPPPALSASVTPQRGPAPLRVTFHAEAKDADNQVVAIEWDLGGGYQKIGPDPQMIFSTPGIYYVSARAMDEAGLASVEQLWVAVAADTGYPPKIVSSPPSTAQVGAVYTYQPSVIGTGSFSWSLGKVLGDQRIRAPKGMSQDQVTGLVTWEPDTGQVGAASVTVVAQNSAGVSFQDFDIEVVGVASSEGCSCGQVGAEAGSLAICLCLLAQVNRFRRHRPIGRS